ncbi:MAG: TIGR04255 family protein, partial [Planctomycetaceae bacterium]
MTRMAIRRHYSKAPITEALIDLRVRLPESVRLEDVATIEASIRSDYPKKAERHIAHGEVRLGSQVAASATTQTVGYLFRSVDDQQIVQM